MLEGLYSLHSSCVHIRTEDTDIQKDLLTNSQGPASRRTGLVYLKTDFITTAWEGHRGEMNEKEPTLKMK
jgi:hypothetical protein